MNLTPAQWAGVMMIGANLIVICFALLNLSRHTEFRSGIEGASPWRILRGDPLQMAITSLWRGLLRLVTAIFCICALAAAMGVGAWIVFHWF